MRQVTYSKEESDIVEKGIVAIQTILMGTDDDAKASLLFCLDKYLDPYFGYNLPYKDEVFDLLETVVVSPNSMDIREDALDLLTSYAGGPFPILERCYENLPQAIKPDVKYAINMHVMQKIEESVLNECIKIFKEKGNENNQFIMGEFPKSATVVYNTDGTEDGEGYDNIHTVEEVWEIKDDKYTVRGIDYLGIPHQRAPISKAYYPVGEFYFNINLNAKEVYLSYIYDICYHKHDI